MWIENNTHGSLLTNFNVSQRKIFEKAIEEYKESGGNLDIYIKDDAYWQNGYLDKSMNSLHTKDRGLCHSEFWRIFDNIKELSKEEK